MNHTKSTITIPQCISIAMHSLKCDFISSFRNLYCLCFFLFLILTLAKIDPVNNYSLVFCFCYIFEVYLGLFTPQCKKIYFLLPLNENDRHMIMCWRVHVVEGLFIVYGIFNFILHNYIYQSSSFYFHYMVIMFTLCIYEIMCITQFNGYKVKKGSKSIVAGVISWIIGITIFLGMIVVMIPDRTANANVPLYCYGYFAFCFIVTAMIRWYYSTQAEYREYHYFNSMSSRKKATLPEDIE